MAVPRVVCQDTSKNQPASPWNVPLQCQIAPGVYASDRNEADDLVALSYIQLSIHGDHLKYTHVSSKTYQTWEALRAIYESASEVNLVTLQLQTSKLEWSERMGLENFNDQFHEFMRKMAAAGDMTPESPYITRYLCLLLPHFANTVMFITHEARTNTRYSSLPAILAELKLDDERHQKYDPNLRRHASRSDDALNTTSGECHYCGKAGHYRPECHRRQTDEAKGIRRRSVNDRPDGPGNRQPNGGRGGRNGRRGGRGRGQNRPRQSEWRGSDQGHYAHDNNNDDLFLGEDCVTSLQQRDDDDDINFA
ncbi:hypothetical protein DYB37_009698 [Aphanomyces astaci]|uniref:CCHC-type domain-containing protein n=1 Tax=Aphanomyces astaci TaxID=112090 RepID=A0A3L6VEB7_APHAT|nr:hypothetical protein DYB35_010002 [Aphanomyces astaci]RHZ27278.1 hypothetical protein DYB37_009698 [Aphanomyces astaci]RLO07142.1 hypothetical protein DYB28_001583 [Aphanomyces astaci]